MTGRIKSFLAHMSGSTAIEYALIAALVAVVTIVSLITLTGNLNSALDDVIFEPGAAFHIEPPK
jgi:Flp pilus assembly pilin Flp